MLFLLLIPLLLLLLHVFIIVIIIVYYYYIIDTTLLTPLPTIAFHFSQLLGTQAARPRIFAGIPSAALYGERRMRWRKQWKCGDKLNAWGAVAGSR